LLLDLLTEDRFPSIGMPPGRADEAVRQQEDLRRRVEVLRGAGELSENDQVLVQLAERYLVVGGPGRSVMTTHDTDDALLCGCHLPLPELHRCPLWATQQYLTTPSSLMSWPLDT
jgi:hypothetical protein